MDDNPGKQMKEKMKLKYCQKTVSSLLKEYESLLQKQMQTGTTGDTTDSDDSADDTSEDDTTDSDSDHSVEQAPLVDDATKQLNDIELAMESIQQQIKLALEQYYKTQQALSISKDGSVNQSDDTQMEVANVSINQQVGQSDDKNGQNEAKRITTEYIKVEELVGISIDKLAESLVKQKQEDRSNLKIVLRSADRFTVMSNLLQLLESDAFTLTYKKAKTMIMRIVKGALKYGPAEGELFMVTCKCVLSLLHCKCRVVYHTYWDDSEDDCRITSFINMEDFEEHKLYYDFFKIMLKLAYHYKKLQLSDKSLLLRIRTFIDRFRDMMYQESSYDESHFEEVICGYLQSTNRVHRIEMARSLLRCSTDPFPTEYSPLTMDNNPGQQLKEKTKHCQKTVCSLLQEFECLIQKQRQTGTIGDTTTVGCSSDDTTDFDSDHSVKQAPLLNDATRQLNDIELAMESIQQQIKLALENYYKTTKASTSKDGSVIQSDDTQMEVANVTINQQVGQSDDKNAQNAAKRNPTSSETQVLFNGTLPDDCYLHLMSVMGVQECLISNRLVCLHWNELVLERCRNQKSLKLFETFRVLMDYGELLLQNEKMDDASLILKSIGDDLIFEGLKMDRENLFESLDQKDEKKKRKASKVLTNLFTKVEQLVLCTESESLINIEHFLQFYAEQLTSLTMTAWNERSGRKLRAFNFPKLKSLHTLYFSPKDDHLLSLLPQLESLTLHSSRISLETLLRTGTQLEELNLEYIDSVYTAPVDEFSKRPRINTNLRKFIFGETGNARQALEFISHHLTSLECLKLDLHRNHDRLPHLHSVTTYLVPLQQLHSLTLETPVSAFLLDDSQFANIQPLPSVRQLKLLLWGYASFSMDLFSRAIFTAFPNVEQILIAFVGTTLRYYYFADPIGRVDAATFAAFEDFAGKHPNVVQLFRSRKLSPHTSLPNAVAPLLGHRRQLYEEYIEEEELFGVPIFKLTAYMVPRKGEDCPNLKNVLRSADRFTAMSNLLQLLERHVLFKATTYTSFDSARSMMHHLLDCARKYGPAEGALFIVTCKCALSLIECAAIQNWADYSFGDTDDTVGCTLLGILLQFLVHYQTRKLTDEELLLQFRGSIEKLLYQLLDTPQLQLVIKQFICEGDPVFRFEIARALLQVCKGDHPCF